MDLQHGIDLVRELHNMVRNNCFQFRVAGSIRRRKEAPTDIDIAISPKRGTDIKATFSNMEEFSGGDKYIKFIYKGIKVQVQLCQPGYKIAGSMMLHTTGPHYTNISMRTTAKKRGWFLNQYGLFDGNDTLISNKEREIRRMLGYKRKVYTKHGSIKKDDKE